MRTAWLYGMILGVMVGCSSTSPPSVDEREQRATTAVAPALSQTFNTNQPQVRGRIGSWIRAVSIVSGETAIADMKTGRVIERLRGLYELGFSPDGRHACALSSKGFGVFDMNERRWLWKEQGEWSPPLLASASHCAAHRGPEDARKLTLFAIEDGTQELRDDALLFRTRDGRPRRVDGLRHTADGRHLILTGRSLTSTHVQHRVLDVTTWKHVQWKAAWDVRITSGDRVQRVPRPLDDDSVRTLYLPGVSQNAPVARFSAKLIEAGGSPYDEYFALLDVATERSGPPLPAEELRRLVGVSVTPDGRVLALQDHTGVYTWSWADSQPVRHSNDAFELRREFEESGVIAPRWSPDGALLGWLDPKGDLHRINVNDGKREPMIELPRQPDGHYFPIRSFAISNDGWVAVVVDDGREIPGSPHLAIGPDARRTVRIWGPEGEFVDTLPIAATADKDSWLQWVGKGAERQLVYLDEQRGLTIWRADGTTYRHQPCPEAIWYTYSALTFDTERERLVYAVTDRLDDDGLHACRGVWSMNLSDPAPRRQPLDGNHPRELIWKQDDSFTATVARHGLSFGVVEDYLGADPNPSPRWNVQNGRPMFLASGTDQFLFRRDGLAPAVEITNRATGDRRTVGLIGGAPFWRSADGRSWCSGRACEFAGGAPLLKSPW